MLYLVTSILALIGLALFVRLGVGRGASPMGLNAVFRGSAGIAALFISAAVLNWSRMGEAFRHTAPLACVAVACFWCAGYTAIKAVHTGHLGISWTIHRCSMLMPAVASLLIWQEVPLSPVTPTLISRVVGIAATVTAVVLLGYDRSRAPAPGQDGARAQDRTWFLWISASFVCQGSWAICVVATRHLPNDDCRALFLTMVFVGAFLLSVPAVAATRTRLGRKELTYGALAGLCSLIGSGARVWATRDLGGLVVFPVSTVSVVLCVQLAGMTIWRERMGRWGVVGVVTALVGVILLSLRL